ncbi:MAG TPA: DUF6602 domain-containing protein [Chloroflexota bacterium]|nr:DUF6602 domain-containing protein [Chloroflexota bacterium]
MSPPRRWSAEPRIRAYFRATARQLLASSSQAVAEHFGLQGGHREDLIRLYLSKIVPERYRIGRGMVFGPLGRSREADVVLWDAANFPSIPLSDHSVYFAESVRTVLEVKTAWSRSEMRDVFEKTRWASGMLTLAEPGLRDELLMMRMDIASLRTGVAHQGALITPHHIGTGVVFLHGGPKADRWRPSPRNLEVADDDWPDAMLLLERGCVVLKDYPAPDQGGSGVIAVLDAGEDALLVFTDALLRLLSDRSTPLETPLKRAPYVLSLYDELKPTSVSEFRLTKPVPGRQPLWSW